MVVDKVLPVRRLASWSSIYALWLTVGAMAAANIPSKYVLELTTSVIVRHRRGSQGERRPELVGSKSKDVRPVSVSESDRGLEPRCSQSEANAHQWFTERVLPRVSKLSVFG